MTGQDELGQARFAAALLEPVAPSPGGLQAWNGSEVTRRFNVYRNNVASSLVGALADTFPVVQALVGEEFFRAMAAIFVRQSPPQSPLLARYGEGFADFIANFEPAATVPYLADVARLEMARLQSLHAADAAPLDARAAQPALGAGERAGELRLTLHPSARLVTSLYPVVSIWGAHQGYGELGAIDIGAAESALVVRPQLDVVVLACDGATAKFIRCLQRGCDLAESAASAAGAQAHFDLSAALGLLLGNGAITSIQLPEEPAS